MRKTIITSSLYFLLLAALMSFSHAVKSPSLSPPYKVEVEPCSMANKTFQGGEEIVYKLYYNWNFVWLSAGEVTFRVNETGGQYHLSATGRTYSSYEWFFKVRDRYDTYVDKQSLLPSTSIRNIHEGKYTLYDKVTFDQNSQKATSLRGKTKAKAKPKTYKVNDCMHDILSIVYFARNIDYEEYNAGAEFPIEIFMDKEVWPLNVKYKGKDRRKKVKKLGHFNTIKFSPEVIAGDVFTENAEMNVWVTDDQNRVPLLIESPVSVGSIKAVLKSYKGLKHEMGAKVD